MKLTIHFTDKEKMLYLHNQGYELKQVKRKEEYHEHIHGSRFTVRGEVWLEWVALKDGKEYNVNETFEKLIKQKLLS